MSPTVLSWLRRNGDTAGEAASMRQSLPAPRRPRVKIGIGVALAAALALVPAAAPAAQAQARPGPILQQETLVTAHPDRCFSEIGGTNPLLTAGQPTCPPGYELNVRQNYTWSAARAGDWAYFGTGPQVLCQGIGTTIGVTEPFRTADNVCELKKGPYAPYKGDSNGDSNPPQVFRYNVVTNTYQDISPLPDPNFVSTLGLRGGFASANDVVLLNGQVIDQTGKFVGMAVFAWEGSTGRYLHSTIDPNYQVIRKGVVVDGVLYMAARGLSGGGAILRYTGSVDNPFSWEKVGEIDNEAFYITSTGNRLAVSGGNTINTAGSSAGGGVVTDGPAKIWLSPTIPHGGLTPANVDQWSPIFSWDQFDPDPVLADTIYWGDIAYWRSCLYVGNYRYDAALTMVKNLWKEYGRPASAEARITDAANSLQGVSYFRICNFGKQNQTVRLLYGDKDMNVRQADGTWVKKPNLLGQSPEFGPASINGDKYEIYNWTMLVFKNKLYMATANAAGFAPDAMPAAFTEQMMGPFTAAQQAALTTAANLLRTTVGGGSLWRMDSPSQPAVAEKLRGFGNVDNHGIRVVVPFEDKGFWLAGTATFQNLGWGGNDPTQPASATHGGYSVLKFTPGPMQAPLDSTIPSFVNSLRVPVVGGA